MSIRENIQRRVKADPEILALCEKMLDYFESEAGEPLPLYMFAQIESIDNNASVDNILASLNILASTRPPVIKKRFYKELSDGQFYEYANEDIIQIIKDGFFYDPETNKKKFNLNEIFFAFVISEDFILEARR